MTTLRVRRQQKHCENNFCVKFLCEIISVCENAVSAGESITPEGVMDMLDTDMATADCVLWVGLSFEQSATTSYFRRVRSALSAAGRFAAVPQFLVNPSDEALWNLLSSCSNQGEVEVAAIIASSDDVLPKVPTRAPIRAPTAITRRIGPRWGLQRLARGVRSFRSQCLRIQGPSNWWTSSQG